MRSSGAPVAAIANSLERGFLTGALKSPDDLAPNDWRRLNPRFQGENFQKNLELVQELEAMAWDKGTTAAQLALAWLLTRGENVVPIPGSRRIQRLEENAEKLVSNLAPRTRVIVTIEAPKDSRMEFVDHAVERACIGHCFSYANYEAVSGEFRVRVRKGSPVVTASTDDAEDMASGEYVVDETDLPLKQIYQCDASDLTKLCIRDLQPGEANGRLGYKPSSR